MAQTASPEQTAIQMEIAIPKESEWTEEKWVTKACSRHRQRSWNNLTIEQRKESLLDLCKKDHDKGLRAIKYVIKEYPNTALDDLEGTKDNPCLVVCLSHIAPKLSVDVFRIRARDAAVSIAVVPSLLEQGINTYTLTKIIRKKEPGVCSDGIEPAGDLFHVDDTSAQECIQHMTMVTANATTESASRNYRKGMGTIEADGGTDEIDGQMMIFTNCTGEMAVNIWHLLSTEHRFDLDTIRMSTGDNLLHFVAKNHLTEKAEEILLLGYQSLLEKPATDGNDWPLFYAVQNKDWRIVKIFMEALNPKQRKDQISSILKSKKVTIPYGEIFKELREYHKPWWSLDILQHTVERDKRETMKGQLMLLGTILDSSISPTEVDPTLLLCEGSGRDKSKALYQEIANCDFEELKAHECFATAVEYKWRKSYYAYLHGLLGFLYVLFLICLTTSLALAAKAPDPREYQGGWDQLRCICEVSSLLYLTAVFVLNCIRVIYHCTTASDHHLNRWEMVSIHTFLEVCRYLSIILIIPLRIVDSDWQWKTASLAIILNGLRCLRYATVLPYLGTYIGTLFLLLKRDIPRLIGLFIVINFSFGGGLYFALIGQYGDSNVDELNNNDTSEIYLLWLTGVRMLAQGSVLTYYGPGGFNWCGAIIYWLFVFVISVVFIAILIAQFYKSYDEFSAKAYVNVIVQKTKIVQQMDEMFNCFMCACRCCVNKGQHPEDELPPLKRRVPPDSDDIKLKDCLVHEMNKRFAESEIKVFKLQKKMDDMVKRLDEVHDMMKNYLVQHPPVRNIQELEDTPTHVD